MFIVQRVSMTANDTFDREYFTVKGEWSFDIRDAERYTHMNALTVAEQFPKVGRTLYRVIEVS